MRYDDRIPKTASARAADSDTAEMDEKHKRGVMMAGALKRRGRELSTSRRRRYATARGRPSGRGRRDRSVSGLSRRWVANCAANKHLSGPARLLTRARCAPRAHRRHHRRAARTRRYADQRGSRGPGHGWRPRIAVALLIARLGPSNTASAPSPSDFTNLPRWRCTSSRTKSVVALQQRPPGTIAQLSGTLGRADDVGEQHRGSTRSLRPVVAPPSGSVGSHRRGVRLAKKGHPVARNLAYRAFGMCSATYREWRTSR